MSMCSNVGLNEEKNFMRKKHLCALKKWLMKSMTLKDALLTTPDSHELESKERFDIVLNRSLPCYPFV